MTSDHVTEHVSGNWTRTSFLLNSRTSHRLGSVSMPGSFSVLIQLHIHILSCLWTKKPEPCTSCRSRSCEDAQSLRSEFASSFVHLKVQESGSCAIDFVHTPHFPMRATTACPPGQPIGPCPCTCPCTSSMLPLRPATENTSCYVWAFFPPSWTMPCPFVAQDGHCSLCSSHCALLFRTICWHISTIHWERLVPLTDHLIVLFHGILHHYASEPFPVGKQTELSTKVTEVELSFQLKQA